LKFGSKILFCWICPEESKGKQKKWWPLNNTIVNTTRLVRGSLEIIPNILTGQRGWSIPSCETTNVCPFIGTPPIFKASQVKPNSHELGSANMIFDHHGTFSQKIKDLFESAAQIILLLEYFLSLMFLERRPFEFE
jgi:hypothetical protein